VLVQVLSDLHFEFHADGGRSFVASLDPRGIDVLVLAGDIAVGDDIGRALGLFAARYPDATLLYVHGNHEFYGSTRAAVTAVTRAAVAGHPNLVWLDGDVATIGGVRFAGAPLWFRHPGPAEGLRARMNDFRLIADFEGWVYAENARAVSFFERELRAGDVAVTHYLPVRASVAPAFAESPLNPFFLCDVEPLVRARRPSLWVHGHTHASIDTTVGATRVVCNPFGYVRIEENAAFRERFTIDVAPA
jgi:predicted phosphodiesterase